MYPSRAPPDCHRHSPPEHRQSTETGESINQASREPAKQPSNKAAKLAINPSQMFVRRGSPGAQSRSEALQEPVPALPLAPRKLQPDSVGGNKRLLTQIWVNHSKVTRPKTQKKVPKKRQTWVLQWSKGVIFAQPLVILKPCQCRASTTKLLEQ